MSSAILVSRAYAYEAIEYFESDIVVAKDSNFMVAEKIAYIFEGEKHGIFRCIPTLHPDQASSFLKERYVTIDLIGIWMDSMPVPYSASKEGGKICFRIGNPDSTITGKHVYEISYKVGGAITYEQYGGAELYWNVTGHDWEVPILSATARVSSPDPILLRERACYQGEEGEIGSCAITANEEGTIIFSARNMGPLEGLTVAQALDRSKVTLDIRERFRPLFLWGLLLMIGAGAGTYALYRYQTKFRTGNPIIPQYEPYEDAKPMYMGMLFDKRLDPRDVVASIVNLAQEGFIKIKKIDARVLFFFEVDDYEIALLRPRAEAENMFEGRVLDLLFKGNSEVGTTVTLSDLKKNYSIVRENRALMQALEADLKKDLKQRGFWTGVLWGRRTRKGYEALDHLKGFKDYLSVTEKERYIFHNAPEHNADHFMEYLPFAIAFGVEKQWAKTFEGITIPNPEWYDSGTGVHAFRAVSLADSLGAFSRSLASAQASASGGGGHAGGGAGGGGGGSW
jgi:uncharacterized membrane protein